MGDTPLFIALKEHTRLYICGAVRVKVLSGEARILGCTLRAGDFHDVVSPPYESSIYLEASHVQDLRLLQSSGHVAADDLAYAVTLAGQGLPSSEGRSSVSPAASRRPRHDAIPDATQLQRCVLELSSVLVLSSCLSDYDVDGAGLHLCGYSTAVRGAVVTPHSGHVDGPTQSQAQWPHALAGPGAQHGAGGYATDASVAIAVHPTQPLDSDVDSGAGPASAAAAVDLPQARAAAPSTKGRSKGQTSQVEDGDARSGSVASRALPSGFHYYDSGILPTDPRTGRVLGAGGAVNDGASGTAAGARAGSGSGAGANQTSSQRCRVVNRVLHEHPGWQAAVDLVTSSRHQGRPVVPCVAVLGPKGAGKSTFMRFLANALLSHQREAVVSAVRTDDDDFGGGGSRGVSGARTAGVRTDNGAAAVGSSTGTGGCNQAPTSPSADALRFDGLPQAVAWLDLDPGQPEHTPAGFVSLTLVTRPLLTPPHVRVHGAAPLPMPLEALTVGLGGCNEDDGDLDDDDDCGADGAGRDAGADDEAGHGHGEHARTGAGARVLQPIPTVQGTPGASELHSSASSLPAFSSSADVSPARVLSMRFVGSNSVKDDIDGFSNAVAQLIALYRQHVAVHGIPLVINTHGWTKGLGALSLQHALGHAQPTQVVHLEALKGAGGSGAGHSLHAGMPAGSGYLSSPQGAWQGEDGGDDDEGGGGHGHSRGDFAPAEGRRQYISPAAVAVSGLFQPGPAHVPGHAVAQPGPVAVPGVPAVAGPGPGSWAAAGVTAAGGLAAGVAAGQGQPILPGPFDAVGGLGMAPAPAYSGPVGTSAGGALILGPPPSTAASGRPDEDAVALWPPAYAWQPVSSTTAGAAAVPAAAVTGLGYRQPRASVAGPATAAGVTAQQQYQQRQAAVQLPAVVMRLPAWHAVAPPPLAETSGPFALNGHGYGGPTAPGGGNRHVSSPSAASQGGPQGEKSLPPRAARSPADARAARLLVYLLSNMRYPDGEALVQMYDDEMAGRRAAKTAGGGAGGSAGTGTPRASPVSSPTASDDADSHSDDGDNDDGPHTTDAAGGPADGDGDDGASANEQAGGEEQGDANSQDDGEQEDEDDTDDLDALLADLTVEPYPDRDPSTLNLVEAGRLYWHRARLAGMTMFAALLNDHRLARTPVAGLVSPAWHARSSMPLRVPVDEALCILMSASETVTIQAGWGRESVTIQGGMGNGTTVVSDSNDTAEGQDGQQLQAKAQALVGTLVALGSRSLARASTAAGSAGQVAVQLPGSALPCLGLAYVRGYDPRGLGGASAGTTAVAVHGSTANDDRPVPMLHLLCPVPASLLAFADTLIGWPGSGSEVPPQLLYCGAPEGDPFCYHPSLLVGAKEGAGAAGKDGQVRKNLKRKRLG